jgi:hypothetical protein
MAQPKFFRGFLGDNGIVVPAVDGDTVFPMGRGRPSSHMVEAECTATGQLMGKARPILKGDLKRQETAARRSAAILAGPDKAKSGTAKRYYLADSGKVEPFGNGPVTFDKWRMQVMGSDDSTFVRTGDAATEEAFTAWKQAQGYKERAGNGGASVTVKQELADLKAQLAEQGQQTAALLALLQAQQATATAKPAGKANGSNGKA